MQDASTCYAEHFIHLRWLLRMMMPVANSKECQAAMQHDWYTNRLQKSKQERS